MTTPTQDALLPYLNSRPHWQGWHWVGAILWATLLCGLNAVKPVAVDDTAYVRYAQQIAEHPLDPYGFTILWGQHPRPAHTLLAPPVFCYWLAFAVRWLGPEPWVWKLWLWPWCLLLTASMQLLLLRFARPLAGWLLGAFVCSPSVLPALNLMLDVPSLALSLSAVAMFLSALDGNSLGRSTLAGVLAGLAMQTKYTALVTSVVLPLAAWYLHPTQRRQSLRLAPLAVTIAVIVFWVWEGYVAYRYGSSHFLYHLSAGRQPLHRKLTLFWPMVGILGGVAAPLGLLALTGLRVRAVVIALGVAAVVLGFAIVALVPDDPPLFSGQFFGAKGITVNALVVGPLGLLAVGSLTILAIRGVMQCRSGQSPRCDRFLVWWLMVEFAGYFALSPFAAARRVLGFVTVAFLFAGRRAAVDARGDGRRSLAPAVSVFCMAIGLLFAAIDLSDARAERRAVTEAAAWVRFRGPQAVVWHVGSWGFEFYAEREGFKTVVPDESMLHAGDYLIVPARRWGQPLVRLPDEARLVHRLTVDTGWPWRTIPHYYGAPTAIAHQEHPYLTVEIYRVASDCRVAAAAGDASR